MCFTQQVFHLQYLFFFLPPFDTWNCSYFKSNLSLVKYIKVLLIKHVILFCSLQNMKKQLSFVYLFLYLSCISLGRYCQKNVFKSAGLRSKIQRGGGFKPSAHYVTTSMSLALSTCALFISFMQLITGTQFLNITYYMNIVLFASASASSVLSLVIYIFVLVFLMNFWLHFLFALICLRYFVL